MSTSPEAVSADPADHRGGCVMPVFPSARYCRETWLLDQRNGITAGQRVEIVQ